MGKIQLNEVVMPEMTRISLIWCLTVLASGGVLVLTGCGLSQSGSHAEITVKREVATAPLSEPLRRVDPEPGETRAQRSPQRVAALNRIDQAKALIGAGNFVGAISHLEKTLAIDATNPHTYFQLARAHHGLGNFQESLNFLEVAESLFGSDQGAPLMEIWALKSDNLRGLGQVLPARQS